MRTPLRSNIASALTVCLACAAMLPAAGCKSVDDNRIPPMPVSLTFRSAGEWDAYGVSGALAWRRFIKSEGQPPGFPYTQISATGFGGVLLVADFNGDPRAYDLACPVEVKQTVRITVDTEAMVGECPVCHSTYDVFRIGGPLSGPAATEGYGLQRYAVNAGGTASYMTVTR